MDWKDVLSIEDVQTWANEHKAHPAYPAISDMLFDFKVCWCENK